MGKQRIAWIFLAAGIAGSSLGWGQQIDRLPPKPADFEDRPQKSQKENRLAISDDAVESEDRSAEHPADGGKPGDPPTASAHATGRLLQKSPYQTDFNALADPSRSGLLGGRLKQMPVPLGIDSTLSFGGELRFRHMNEDNRLRPGGPGRSTFDLWRWQNYLDFRSHYLRLYVEMIDASLFNEELPPLPIDANRADVQNAFADIPIRLIGNRSLVFRVGRQELLYGSQRLISPLNWSNTRRNFEGFNLLYSGETWDLDAFATRPVNSGSGNVFRPTSRDKADASRTFSGVYASWHKHKQHTVDLYWLWLNEQEERPALADGSRHTLGLRWEGRHPVKNAAGETARAWHWDLEGAYQVGHDDDFSGTERDVEAGFFTTILDHTWKTLPWQPKLTALYYWGSGDRDPTDDENNTFSVLFPLGHAYWGIIDNLSGQNLQDYSIQAAAQPTEKLSLQVQMHWFDLASNADRLYNVAGVGIGPTGFGQEAGEELDLVATYQVNPHFDIQVGQSWFWFGSRIENTSLRREDATQFYVQSHLRY